jgi:hypothetical protein
MKLTVMLFMAAAYASPGSTAWIEEVAPIITAEERSAYLTLTDDRARENFVQEFWGSKQISAEDYYRRIAHVDANFGSGKLLSGCRRHGAGDYALYSPSLDTIRALLNPQSSTRGMFPVNDVVTEADIRTRLNLSPVEEEIIEVARGIKGVGNDEILALAVSPATIRGETRTKVSSRLVLPSERPQMLSFESPSENGTAVIDLVFDTKVRKSIELKLATATGVLLEDTQTSLGFTERDAVLPCGYVSQEIPTAGLLPGFYTLEASANGVTRSARLDLGRSGDLPLLISYNANLSPDQESSAIGRQWLVRGNLREARKNFERALSIQPSDRNKINLAHDGSRGRSRFAARSPARNIAPAAGSV